MASGKKVRFEGPDGRLVDYIDHEDLQKTKCTRDLIRQADAMISSGGPRRAADEAVLFKAYHARGRLLHNAVKAGSRGRQRAKKLDNQHRLMLDFLVNQNIGLVYDMLRRSRVMEVDRDDLVSEGFWTLMQSITNFDPWRGFRFSTYACRSILRGYLLLAKKRRRQIDRLEVIRESHDGTEAFRAEGRELDKQVLIARLKQALTDNSANLTAAERFVIELRMLHSPSTKPATLESIGRAFKLSKERVRQIQVTALDKLRDVIAANPQAGMNAA